MTLATSRIALGATNQPPTLLWMRRLGDERYFDYTTELGFKTAQYFLRDVLANRVGIPDTRMLATLAWMQAWLALHSRHVPFDVLSGLRTIQTNRLTEGAAQNSLHLPDAKGTFRATDFRMPSIPSDYMAKLATLLRQGGVGLYDRDFVHLDTGTIRQWKSR